MVGCSISVSVSHSKGTHHRGRAGRTRGSRSFSILLRGLFFVVGVVGVVGVVFGTVVVNRLLRGHRWKKKQSVSIDRAIETYTINRSKDMYTTPNVIRACMFIIGSVWEVTQRVQRVQPTSTNQHVTTQHVTNQQQTNMLQTNMLQTNMLTNQHVQTYRPVWQRDWRCST